ncbi:MAG: T9SS type A sorting domain-containing protein [Saprospiraceae bacterium]
MKNYLSIWLIFFFSIVNLTAQNCEISPILLDEYEKDVKHLTLIQMEQFNAQELNNIEIPQNWQDTIWEGLAAIFNSTSPYRDEIFDEYCVHHNSWTVSDYMRISNSINIRPETNVSWFQNWESGNIITGDPYIDSLTQKYGFVDIYLPFPSLGIFNMTTEQNLNLNALTDSLLLSSHITLAEPKNFAGGADLVRYQNIDGQRYYYFSIGWGDCQSGCIYYLTWTFQVDEDCNVSFLGYTGETNNLPDPKNCDISTVSSTTELLESSTFNIFPNPANNFINIYSEERNSRKFKYSIYDFTGKELIAGSFQNNIEIDISILTKGIYVISIDDNNWKKEKYKFVKK